MKGEIATARFQSLARRAQYHIFLFRERMRILMSLARLPVLVRGSCDGRSKSYRVSFAIMSASSPELTLGPENIPGGVISQPYARHTAAALQRCEGPFVVEEATTS